MTSSYEIKYTTSPISGIWTTQDVLYRKMMTKAFSQSNSSQGWQFTWVNVGSQRTPEMITSWELLSNFSTTQSKIYYHLKWESCLYIHSPCVLFFTEPAGFSLKRGRGREEEIPSKHTVDFWEHLPALRCNSFPPEDWRMGPVMSWWELWKKLTQISLF